MDNLSLPSTQDMCPKVDSSCLVVGLAMGDERLWLIEFTFSIDDWFKCLLFMSLMANQSEWLAKDNVLVVQQVTYVMVTVWLTCKPVRRAQRTGYIICWFHFLFTFSGIVKDKVSLVASLFWWSGGNGVQIQLCGAKFQVRFVRST